MANLESELLDKALNNQQNAILLKLNSKQIANMNKQIVSSIPHISAPATISHIKMLKGYRYVDEISDLKTNVYIKWIRMDSPNKLTKGAISCSVKITNDGMLVMCKNHFGKFFYLSMEECVLFQKITSEESVILSAMDFITLN
jgi:hypothetical protein